VERSRQSLSGALNAERFYAAGSEPGANHRHSPRPAALQYVGSWENRAKGGAGAVQVDPAAVQKPSAGSAERASHHVSSPWPAHRRPGSPRPWSTPGPGASPAPPSSRFGGAQPGAQSAQGAPAWATARNLFDNATDAGTVGCGTGACGSSAARWVAAPRPPSPSQASLLQRTRFAAKPASGPGSAQPPRRCGRSGGGEGTQGPWRGRAGDEKLLEPHQLDGLNDAGIATTRSWMLCRRFARAWRKLDEHPRRRNRCNRLWVRSRRTGRLALPLCKTT